MLAAKPVTGLSDASIIVSAAGVSAFFVRFLATIPRSFLQLSGFALAIGQAVNNAR